MKGSKNLKNQTQTCTQRINQSFWKCQNQVQQTVLFKQKDLGNGISIYCQKLCQCLNSSFSRGATRWGARQHQVFLNSRERGTYPIGHPNGHSHASEWNPGTFSWKSRLLSRSSWAPPASPHSHPTTPVFCFDPFVDRHKVVIIRRFSQVWPI